MNTCKNTLVVSFRYVACHKSFEFCLISFSSSEMMKMKLSSMELIKFRSDCGNTKQGVTDINKCGKVLKLDQKITMIMINM